MATAYSNRTNKLFTSRGNPATSSLKNERLRTTSLEQRLWLLPSFLKSVPHLLVDRLLIDASLVSMFEISISSCFRNFFRYNLLSFNRKFMTRKYAHTFCAVGNTKKRFSQTYGLVDRAVFHLLDFRILLYYLTTLEKSLNPVPNAYS